MAFYGNVEGSDTWRRRYENTFPRFVDVVGGMGLEDNLLENVMYFCNGILVHHGLEWDWVSSINPLSLAA
jgi:hypothetical protein